MKKLTTEQLIAIYYRILRINQSHFMTLLAKVKTELKTRSHYSMATQYAIAARYSMCDYPEFINTPRV